MKRKIPPNGGIEGAVSKTQAAAPCRYLGAGQGDSRYVSDHENRPQIYKNVATVPLHKPKGMVYYKRILAELLPQMPR